MLSTSIVILLLSIFSAFATPASAELIEGGTARADITPPLSIKTPLGGYGERMNRPATGVHDRIFAKALSISAGSRRFVIITADMIGFPPTFKPEIVKELGDESISLENLMLLPSHSHTSIEMNAFNPDNHYQIPQIGIYSEPVHRFLLEKFVTLIRDACRHSVPVSIGTSTQKISGWNRNRRHADGYTDDDLTVTRVDRLDGTSLAVLINFAAHPTFLGASHMEFSGDWPGQLQRTV